MDSLPKKKSEKKSSAVFCKNFLTKVFVLRVVLFFKMNGLTATKLGISEKHCKFSVGSTVFF